MCRELQELRRRWRHAVSKTSRKQGGLEGTERDAGELDMCCLQALGVVYYIKLKWQNWRSRFRFSELNNLEFVERSNYGIQID